MPPSAMSWPAMMKNGIASSGVELTPLAMRCATISGGMPSISTVTRLAMPSPKAIGTPSTSSTPNVPSSAPMGPKSLSNPKRATTPTTSAATMAMNARRTSGFRPVVRSSASS